MSRRKKRKPQKPKTLRWRLECLGHSIIEGLAAMLPGPWVFRLGEMLGALAWHLMPQRRRIVLRNLRIAFAGEKDLTEIHQLARATFRRSGANLVSVSHTARLSPAQLRNALSVENLHLLENAQSRGKGVVLLLAHMGNWELLSRIIHLFPPGSKCGAFSRPLNNPLLDARVLARRQADGTRMFSKRDPFHEVTKFLRDGGIVGILADQRVGMQGEVVPFFGRLTRASPLPSLLARRAKAEVLALSVVTESPGKWRAVFHPVASPPTTAHCMAALETAMKSSPADVFWLQERWKVYAKRYRPFTKWLPPDVPPGEKPHRILLWLPGADASWELPPDWQHPDAVYEVVVAPGCPAPAWLPQGSQIHHHRPPAADLIRDIDSADRLPIDFILVPPGKRNRSDAPPAGDIPLVLLR
jgi:KDO2-lipid IV(A) lauroyltransferase